MALTKQTVVDKIEIVGEHSHIQVREAQQILEDGVVISQNYHRYVVAPGQSSSDPKVAAIIAAVHTPAVISAYEAYVASQQTP